MERVVYRGDGGERCSERTRTVQTSTPKFLRTGSSTTRTACCRTLGSYLVSGDDTSANLLDQGRHGYFWDEADGDRVVRRRGGKKVSKSVQVARCSVLLTVSMTLFTGYVV